MNYGPHQHSTVTKDFGNVLDAINGAIECESDSYELDNAHKLAKKLCMNSYCRAANILGSEVFPMDGCRGLPEPCSLWITNLNVAILSFTPILNTPVY